MTPIKEIPIAELENAEVNIKPFIVPTQKNMEFLLLLTLYTALKDLLKDIQRTNFKDPRIDWISAKIDIDTIDFAKTAFLKAKMYLKKAAPERATDRD